MTFDLLEIAAILKNMNAEQLKAIEQIAFELRLAIERTNRENLLTIMRAL